MTMPLRSVATTMSGELATSCSSLSLVRAMRGPSAFSALAAVLREPALAVDGGHATGAGGRDRLAVGGIHRVAADEHAGHARARAAGLDLQVADLVEVEL